MKQNPTFADLKLESLRCAYTDEDVAGHLLNLALAKSGADSTPASIIDDVIVELVRGLAYLANGEYVPRLDFSHAVHIAKRVHEELEKEWRELEKLNRCALCGCSLKNEKLEQIILCTNCEDEEDNPEYCEGCGLEAHECECDEEENEEDDFVEPNEDPEDDYRNTRRG